MSSSRLTYNQSHLLLIRLRRDHLDHQDMRLDPLLLALCPVPHPDLIAVQNTNLLDKDSPIFKLPCWKKG